MVRNVAALFRSLDHQHGIRSRVEIFKGTQVVRKLIAQDKTQGHDDCCPRVEFALSRAPRQRSEQYFTSSQARSHFLRHVNERRQVRQTLVGRSVFWRIFDIDGCL
jgi:hypothetical protein